MPAVLSLGPTLPFNTPRRLYIHTGPRAHFLGMHVWGFLCDLNFSLRRPPIPRWKALDASIQRRAPGWLNQPGSARARVCKTGINLRLCYFAYSPGWLIIQTIMHAAKSSVRSDHDLRSEIKFFLTVWQNERGYFRKVLIRL